MDGVLCLLAPHVLGDGLDECDLGPLLVFGELVAFLGGGEAALGGQAQAVERSVLGGFLDAGLMVSGSSRSGFLEVIRPSTTFLSPETSASGAKIAGTVVVELEVVASTFSSPNSLAATGA